MLDHGGDTCEPDAILQKRCHGHFVGRVVDGRCRATDAAGRNTEVEHREVLVTQALELERTGFHGIESSKLVLETLRTRQGVQDRDFHRRVSQLGHRGTIPEFHHRMDDRRGVDDDLDLIKIEPEQQMRLDDLDIDFIAKHRFELQALLGVSRCGGGFELPEGTHNQTLAENDNVIL